MTKVLMPESKIEWHGEAVTMSDVLASLAGIRAKFERAEAGDDEHAHPRSCVLTLVAIAADEEEERRALKACRVIASQHPAQAIVIRERAGLHKNAMDAWITTEVQRPAMAGATECEIVTLHVHSAAADHLAPLVDPLLVSGVPTYLWWVGSPSFGGQEMHEGLSITDSLVFDSARFAEPHRAFHGLSKLLAGAHQRLGLGDLQWARLRPWREAIAQFFTPSDRRGFLSGISEVGLEYAGEGRGNRIAAAVVTGWMASALGWKLKRVAAGIGGAVVAHYAAGDRTVDVAFSPVANPHLLAGEVGAVRIAGASQGKTFRLSVRRDPERSRGVSADPVYRTLHSVDGDDDAGVELASRRAEWHRDVLHENVEFLHHTATGDPPGESRPAYPVVFLRERRRKDASQVFLTMIEIGEGSPLRHVQQVEPQEEAALLLDLLATGTHDHVFNRSLAAAAALINKF